MKKAILVVEKVYHTKYYEVDEQGEVVGADGEQVDDLAKGNLIDEWNTEFDSEYQVWLAIGKEWEYHKSFPLDELDKAVALVKEINSKGVPPECGIYEENY